MKSQDWFLVVFETHVCRSARAIVNGDIKVRTNNPAPYFVDALVVPLQVVGVGYVPIDVNSTEFTLTVSNQTAIANYYEGVNATVDPSNSTLDNLVNAEMDWIVHWRYPTTAARASFSTVHSQLTQSGRADTVSQQNAKACIVICLDSSFQLEPYTIVMVEIRTSVGATLMIARAL